MEDESRPSPTNSFVSQDSRKEIVKSSSPSTFSQDKIDIHVSCIAGSEKVDCQDTLATQKSAWVEPPGSFIDSQTASIKPTANSFDDEEKSNQSKSRWMNELKNQGLIFGKIMIPVAIISFWMFGLYAILSWVIPSVLCKTYAEDLSGSTVGLYECIYNTDAQYSNINGRKVFWLAFWSIQSAWVAMFPGFVAYAMFGKHVTKLQLLGSGCTAVGCFAAVLTTALAYDMALNNYIVIATSALGSFMVNVICSSAAVRYTEDKIMKWRWIFLFMLAGQVNTLYLFVIPRVLTLRSSDVLGGMALTVVRLGVHPVIWGSVLFFFRSVQRHIGHVHNMQQLCFLVWPVLYSTLYGRFLLLQLENVGSVVVMNFLIACFTISSDLIERGTDAPWVSFLYGKRAKDALNAVEDVDEIALAHKLAMVSMESASIFATSSLFSFGGISPIVGQSPNNLNIWLNALAQLATTVIFSFIELVTGSKFHKYEWNKVYPKSLWKVLLYVLPVLTIGGSRLCVELLLLFCPRVDDSYGVLLEQCDKRSLFEELDMSSFLSRPRVQAVEGPWINLGAPEL